VQQAHARMAKKRKYQRKNKRKASIMAKQLLQRLSNGVSKEMTMKKQ